MKITALQGPTRHSLGIRKLIKKWVRMMRQRRELRKLDDLPDYLLRDMGLDHLTRAERSRLDRDVWF